MMIDPDKFMSTYIDDALSISALCSDLGLSRDDAKLYTYIFVKSTNHASGLEYFSDEREEEIAALEIMLGLKEFTVHKSFVGNSDACQTVLKDFGAAVSERINALDYSAREMFGTESYLHSELLRRLRFHRDVEYRKEKLAFFSSTILPRMKEYTRKKVFEVFERERGDCDRIILNFRDSLN